MTTATSHTVRVAQTIRAARERLFDAWTDPENLKHWWRMEGDGWTFAGATVDLKVGGRYQLAMTGPDGTTHAAFGVYQVVDRPARLVFTWDWEKGGSKLGETLVTVEFNSQGNGRTEVVLTHERFADAERMRGHEQGWTQLLHLLGRFGENAT